MDLEKKMQMLVSENEFLQLQLEDINNELKKKDEEIDMLANCSNSAAFLRSKIESNLLEIEQLKYYNELNAQKSEGLQMLNEELELDLLNQIKARQNDQISLKEMESVKANFEVITEELNEAATLYKKLQITKGKLAEYQSLASLTEIENLKLKDELEEQRELINLLRIKKPV